MNLNYPVCLNEPYEFLYYVIHEAVHVVYERYHQVPPLQVVTASDDWSYLKLFLHYEGYAVCESLHLRQARGLLIDEDQIQNLFAAEGTKPPAAFLKLVTFIVEFDDILHYLPRTFRRIL